MRSLSNIRKTAEKGQSLVEFAFMLVVLLILLSGIVDGTRALYTFMAMRDAAQEGALYASYQPSQTSSIQARAGNSSDIMRSLYSNSSVTVTVTPTVSGKLCAGSTSGSSHGITVAINYPSFPLVMPLIGVFIGGQTVPISTSVTDTILAPKCTSP